MRLPPVGATRRTCHRESGLFIATLFRQCRQFGTIRPLPGEFAEYLGGILGGAQFAQRQAIQQPVGKLGLVSRLALLDKLPGSDRQGLETAADDFIAGQSAETCVSAGDVRRLRYSTAY